MKVTTKLSSFSALRILSICGMVLFLGLTLCISPSSAAESETANGSLQLPGGDYLSGRLVSSEMSDTIAWQHPEFDTPFVFPLRSIMGAAFSASEDKAAPTESVCLDLSDGDRLFGDVIDIDPDWLTLRTTALGELKVSRSEIRRLIRVNKGADGRFVGPGQLSDWTVEDSLDDDSTKRTNLWQGRGGQLGTNQPHTSIYRGLEIAGATRIDLELSWGKNPDFVVAFGMAEKVPELSAKKAFRLEVWGNDLVALWELEELAMVTSIGKIDDLDGRISLSIEIDQRARNALIWSPSRRLLGEVRLDSTTDDEGSGIWIQNLASEVQVDGLQILSLRSLKPHERQEPGASETDVIDLQDGTCVSGTLTSVDDAVWLIDEVDSDSESPREIDASDVLQVRFARLEEKVEERVNEDDEPTDEGEVVVQCQTHSGSRFTGGLVSVSDGRLEMQALATRQNVVFPISQIRSLRTIAVCPPGPGLGGGIGRLEIANTRVHGKLAPPLHDGSATPIAFQPFGGSSSTILPTLVGRIVYRDPPPKVEKPKVVPRPPIRNAGAARLFFGAFQRAFGNNEHNRPSKIATASKSVYLRSGEIIPADITSIDADGLTFKSDVTTETRLSHSQILAVQLISGVDEPEIDEVERERLLTVPRNRKKSPPTHLVIARNGDILRGRLLRMTEDTVEVESRLETLQIERSVVSQIFWLGDGESDDDSGQIVEQNADENQFEVQAVMRNGNRISIKPIKLKSDLLIGESSLLGLCRVQVSNVDTLRIGNLTDLTSLDTPFRDWNLSDAPEPMLLDDEPGRGSGATSPLVGTEAPDFKLDLLEGGEFVVSKQKGKIIVLDFWATWCGPCMKAMPVIDEVVSRFSEEEVILVAVNLQETAEPIRRTLERLQLSPIVALDIDGVAAGRYQADAIPQTVVIDREGKITSLLVGGGPKLDGQLTKAIKAALDQENSTE